MKAYLILINKQRKKCLEKEVITRHMQLSTIATNYLVFLAGKQVRTAFNF